MFNPFRPKQVTIDWDMQDDDKLLWLELAVIELLGSKEAQQIAFSSANKVLNKFAYKLINQKYKKYYIDLMQGRDTDLKIKLVEAMFEKKIITQLERDVSINLIKQGKSVYEKK